MKPKLISKAKATRNVLGEFCSLMFFGVRESLERQNRGFETAGQGLIGVNRRLEGVQKRLGAIGLGLVGAVADGPVSFKLAPKKGKWPLTKYLIR